MGHFNFPYIYTGLIRAALTRTCVRLVKRQWIRKLMQLINFAKLLFERRCPFLSLYSVGGRWIKLTCDFGLLTLIGKSRNTLRQKQAQSNFVERKSRLDLPGVRRQSLTVWYMTRFRLGWFVLRRVIHCGVASSVSCLVSSVGPLYFRLGLAQRWGRAAGSCSDHRNLNKYTITWWWHDTVAYLRFVTKT